MAHPAIEPGLTGETTLTASEEHSARHLGSGGVRVFATPAMIALMEGAAVAAIDPLLPAGQASVGIEIHVRHLAATPLGQKVRARAEITAVEGRQITFRVQAWDERDLIGEGTHTRFIIDLDRYWARVERKMRGE
ncbi:MAG: thioesterase family protein [Anaerolineae bacterium]|nr:thioesterase family protein [Anaerolineae bacterium]